MLLGYVFALLAMVSIGVLGILSKYADHCEKAGTSPFEKAAATSFKEAVIALLAPRTAATYITQCTALFTWAVAHGHATSNPFAGIKISSATLGTSRKPNLPD